jgi:hypothetical protein
VGQGLNLRSLRGQSRRRSQHDHADVAAAAGWFVHVVLLYVWLGTLAGVVLTIGAMALADWALRVAYEQGF